MKRKAAIMAIAMTVSTIFTGAASGLVVHAEESVNMEVQSEGNEESSNNSESNETESPDTGSSDNGSSNTGNSESGNTDTGNGSSGSNDAGSADAGNNNSGNADMENSDSGNSNSESQNSGNSSDYKDEADKTVGDILDEIFGQDKPTPDPDAEGTTGGMTEEEAHESEIRGNRPSGYIDESGNYYKYQYNEDGSWHLDGLGISGTGTPTFEDIEKGLAENTGASGNGGTTGSSANINPISPGKTVTTSNNDGSVTTLVGNADGTVTVTTSKIDGTVAEVTVPGSSFLSPGVLPTGVTTFVSVTDEATLDILPNAMIVTAPDGISFVHALNPERTIYSVWSDGYQVDSFMIKDADGAFVQMLDATIVVTADNKAYVNVTLPENVEGAEVFAAEEQRVGFVKLYGINGVMINGELAEEFVIPEN